MTVSGSITLPNEESQRRVYLGIETPGARGTAVAVDHKLYGKLNLNKRRDLVDHEEYLGTFDPWHTPVYGPVEIDGTYEQLLSYEDLALLLRLGVKGAVAGATDSHATPSYLYDYSPSAFDDLDTASYEEGVPGLVWTGELLHFPQFTISGDTDDAEAAWKFAAQVFAKTKDLKAATTGTGTIGSTSTTLVDTGATWGTTAFVGSYVKLTGGTGAGQVRRIVSHTATALTISPAWVTTPDATSTYSIGGMFTQGIADRTRNRIDAPGTIISLDPAGGTLGATPVDQQVVSWSVTWDNASYGKRFMENTDGFSNKIGRGYRKVTGQLRMEFDNREEYDAWIAKDTRLLRILKTGALINDTPNSYTATIDIPALYWNSPIMNEVRNNNITATFPFWAFYDSGSAEVADIKVRTTQATLP